MENKDMDFDARTHVITWSTEELIKLAYLYYKYSCKVGDRKELKTEEEMWGVIASEMVGKTPKQCELKHRKNVVRCKPIIPTSSTKRILIETNYYKQIDSISPSTSKRKTLCDNPDYIDPEIPTSSTKRILIETNYYKQIDSISPSTSKRKTLCDNPDYIDPEIPTSSTKRILIETNYNKQIDSISPSTSKRKTLCDNPDYIDPEIPTSSTKRILTETNYNKQIYSISPSTSKRKTLCNNPDYIDPEIPTSSTKRILTETNYNKQIDSISPSTSKKKTVRYNYNYIDPVFSSSILSDLQIKIPQESSLLFPNQETGEPEEILSNQLERKRNDQERLLKIARENEEKEQMQRDQRKKSREELEQKITILKLELERLSEKFILEEKQRMDEWIMVRESFLKTDNEREDVENMRRILQKIRQEKICQHKLLVQKIEHEVMQIIEILKLINEIEEHRIHRERMDQLEKIIENY